MVIPVDDNLTPKDNKEGEGRTTAVVSSPGLKGYYYTREDGAVVKAWQPDEHDAKMAYARGEIEEEELFRRVAAARKNELLEEVVSQQGGEDDG